MRIDVCIIRSHLTRLVLRFSGSTDSNRTDDHGYPVLPLLLQSRRDEYLY